MFPIRVPYSTGYPGYKKTFPYRGRKRGSTRRARKVSYRHIFPYLIGQKHVMYKNNRGEIDDETLAYYFNPFIHYVKYPHNMDTYDHHEGEYFVVLNMQDEIIDIYRYEI